MGVVNNRIDIDALEKSSGGGGGGGLTVDLIWTGNLTSTEKDIAADLLKDYADYTFLSANYKDGSGNVTPGNLLPVADMGTAVNFINMGSQAFWITVTDTAFKVKAGASLSNVKLYGIK